MRTLLRTFTITTLTLLALVSVTAVAQRAASPAGASGDATARIVTAAQAVVASLDEAGRAKV